MCHKNTTISLQSHVLDCMVRGWIAKSDDRTIIKTTNGLDWQQCHDACQKMPGCKDFYFDAEKRMCIFFSGISSAASAIRSPTLKSVIGLKSGKVEKWFNTLHETKI